MITIYPTAESGLNPTDYKVVLPGHFISIQPKAYQLSRSLNGNPILTMYSKSNIGTINTVEMNLKPDVYNQLEKIVSVDDVFVVITAGKKYNASIDITKASETKVNNIPYYKCTVQFIVIKELI